MCHIWGTNSYLLVVLVPYSLDFTVICYLLEQLYEKNLNKSHFIMLSGTSFSTNFIMAGPLKDN